ncbi:MAG: LptF/LptG family permease [Bacteroidetes bacterium]|nr:LptF/LptG family permease [Bacteroidota bacterium]
MKRLDWFILKSYLGPLVMTFFIALFILLMQFLWKYIDDLVGKGLELYIILKLLFFASSTFVPMALPLAILLSSLMTFGNLGEHYELVTMKAAGISLFRIMRPLIVVSILISILAFYFADVILPKANLKFLSLLYDVREKKLAFNLREGVFYNGIDGFVIRVGKKDTDGNTIRDVMVYDHTKHLGNVSLTVAEWGKMELSADKRFLVFRLYNGYNYEERVDLRRNEMTRPFQRTKFSEQYQMFDLSGLQLTRTDENLFKKNYEMQNIGQLLFSIDSIRQEIQRERKNSSENLFNNFAALTGRDSILAAFKRKPADKPEVKKIRKFYASYVLGSFETAERVNIINSAYNTANAVKENITISGENFATKEKLVFRHQIVFQKKFTFSIACFLLFFIGAPLGAIIRKGGLGMPAVISTIFFIVYWIISFTGEKYAADGQVPVWQGMWLASAVLLPIGAFLTRKATVDASLLDVDSWIKLFQKIFRIQTEQGL